MMRFERELDYIQDKTIKEMTQLGVDNLPDYFFTVPSSSSGKYHPSFAIGDGGLYRHTTFAVGIAKDLFNITAFTPLEQDCIISALILHDGLKQGIGTGHTEKNHPLLMARHLQDLWKDYEVINNDIDMKMIILKCIASHMGKFNEKGMLPIPQSKIEEFVHSCDYLSSRKIYNEYYK